MNGVRPRLHLVSLPQVPAVAADDGATGITIIDNTYDLAPFMSHIADLSMDTVDSNPLFEGATLMSAMKELGKGVRMTLIWRSSAGKWQLIGLFPCQARRFYLGLPLRIWTIWLHIHSFLATPLVRIGYEVEAIRRFLAYADFSGAPLVRFPLFEADGAFDQALNLVLAERKLASVETNAHERAFLKSDLDGEAYLAQHMRKKKRKEYNRLWNRLNDEGKANFTVDAVSNVDDWVAEFLRLEQSGWKGKRGTALAERKNERAFFESMCREAHREGKLHRLAITLDGKPIAMLASFLSGGGAYSFKIAYDEHYARFSPGALLMMKAIGAFLVDPRIAWVDSCAIPNHPMIDHIWAERRRIRTVNAGTSHPVSPFLISYSAHASRLFESAWGLARNFYYRIRKEVEREQSH